ncbi:MAG TPA: hypothetical protein DCR70_02040 [Phycisphaerales bacterium]|nr:hypothetical protein [Phycisphaerales bacterium]
MYCNNRWSRYAWIVAMTCAATLSLAFAPHAVDGWRAELDRRLAALQPERSAEYLALAEDVMDRASTAPAPDVDRALARQLASLAGALDVREMGRSAALFLVDHAAADADRSRMLALAMLLDPSSDARVEAAERSEAVMSLVRAFALYRRGEGTRAKEALASSGAAALLERHPEILKGGSARFRADCEAMRTSGAPAMAQSQVDGLHSLAAGSIAGAPRSWSEALARVGAGPLPEVDLNDPRGLFGVDPNRCIWDGKGWTERKAAPLVIPAPVTVPAAKPRG